MKSKRGTKSVIRSNPLVVPIITVDGPSGSGKGAIGQNLAEKLGWNYLDSGAIYRVLAFAIIKKQISLDSVISLVNLGKNLDIKFISRVCQSPKVIFESEDVTEDIRYQNCGNLASKIAVIPAVREALIAKQRSFRRSPGLVADGRDMGTVVFPDAKLKLFLTATLEIRAKRRLLQLQHHGINATLSTVLGSLADRDKRDQKRIVAPLKPDPSAVIIDTTKLSIDEVLQRILAHVNNMHFKPRSRS